MNIAIKTHVHYQMPPATLIQHSLTRERAVLSEQGALVINTGKFTGRSPADKFIVSNGPFEDHIDWNNFNQPVSRENFLLLLKDIIRYMDKLPEIWTRDVFACADQQYRISVRVINEYPEGNLFAANMFIANDNGDEHNFNGWQVIHAPGFLANPLLHGTRNTNFTIISFEHKIILIGGSGYTGEIKKAIFSVLNLLLPLEYDVLSMHCSATDGTDGPALFFGLSGTGKTTLSADLNRTLIGDDEHGWNNDGVFNLEGGCYAKIIGLSPEHEPTIFSAIGAGSLVENTVFYPGTNKINFNDGSITENTRASYPLQCVKEATFPSVTGNPENIFFLACDGYGVLPPISKLTESQAIAYFLCGYTARVAGTENGVLAPQAVFSPCFGAPFLPLSPAVYAEMFYKKLVQHRPNVWMINTGWYGGSYGQGQRIPLKYTRSMVEAALSKKLDNVRYEEHPIFKLAIPVSCPDVPDGLLNPANSWADIEAYRIAATDLKTQLDDTFERHQQLVDGLFSSAIH